MLTTVKKLIGLLSPAERRRAFQLLAMVIIMAFLDVLGVASIMPFMAVLANPEAVESNRYLADVYAMLGFTEPQRFLFFLGMVVFVALLISIAFKAFTTYVLLRFSHMCDYSIGCRFVAGYLRQPYEWFLNRHSADLSKSVLSEVGQVVNQALIPTMQILSHGAVAVALLLLLVAVDPKLAVVVALGLGGAYLTIYLLLRRWLARIGAERVRANQQRYQAVQEAFGGIKEVKISGYEHTYLERFARSAKRFARHQAASQVAAQLPRYVLEAVAFGGILLVVLYLMAKSDGLQTALPVIALYAFAGYRLMPALQQVYAQFSKLRFAGAALDSLHKDLTGLILSQKKEDSAFVDALHPHCSIKLQHINYSYPNANEPAIEGLSLIVPVQTTIGLVGLTGSGKTTTVDIILGLLQPQRGLLRVDDVAITAENVRRWQRAVGYVPQYVYLVDDTVAANIAFGLPPGEIDMQAVERAARIANLHQFIVDELPHGYDTLTGERGVRLSGGQRQRIGIARALYHDPSVLILDEATSALDNLTEQAVMEAVRNLGDRKTIIIIAHRLSTVRECDCIYLLAKGDVVAQGSYKELVNKNAQFQKMAEHT